MPSIDPIQRFQDILENISEAAKQLDALAKICALAPLKAAIQVALTQLRGKEGEAP